MEKRITLPLIIERISLFIVGFCLFLRLFIWRFFLVSQPQYQSSLFFSYVIDASDVIISFIILFAMSIFLVKLIVNKEDFPHTELDILLFLFFVVSLFSLTHSADRNLTLRGIIFLFTNIAAFYILINFLTSRYRIHIFMALLIALGVAVSILGIIHYFFVFDYITKELTVGAPMDSASVKHMIAIKRIGSSFGWPNRLSGFLMLIIPLSFASIFLQEKRQDRLGAALITAILFLAMFFTNSISGWVSFITAALICSYLYILPQKIKRPWRRQRLILTCSLIIAFIGLSLLLISKRTNIFTLSSIKSRINYLYSTLCMIKEHPMLGSGLNTFGIVGYNFISSLSGYSLYSHNSYLQIWAETGVFGFILFVSIVLYILKTAAEGLNYFQRHKDKFVLTVILCGILAFIIDNLFSYTILAPENAIFWWVTVAVMFSWIKSTKFPLDKVYHRSRLLNSRFIIAIWLMATSIFGLCLLRLGIADNYFYKGTSYLRTGNVSAALDFLKKAKGLNPIDGKISSAQGEVYLVCYKVTKDKNYLDYAKGEFERAVRLRPKVANNYLFLGHIYMAQDEIEMARKNYSKASMLAPYSDEYRRLAQCIK